jgi:folylpolyglutamate synthase/dihydrofolate synthase
VGRFTSPHLVEEWDGLQVGGKGVGRQVYESAREEVERVDREGGVGATSFEVLAATAFEVFRRTEGLEMAIVEVGMGGATDATNVVDAERTLLSIVTAIELDHQTFLGDTIRKIATVKAGILKRGGEAVLARQEHIEIERVLEEVATSMGSTVYFAGVGTPITSSSTTSSPLVSLPLHPLRSFPPSSSPTSPPPPIETHLPLPGTYQLSNSATAVLAAQILRTSPRILSLLPSLSHISDSHIHNGISSTQWPGRLDWVSVGGKKVLIDGAHNPSSAELLAQYLESLGEEEGPTTLVMGLSSPRDPHSILSPLLRSGRIKKVVCVLFSKPEGMEWIVPTPTKSIAEVVEGMGLEVRECEDVEDALKECEGEKVVVAGSLYLAADVYRLMRRGM